MLLTLFACTGAEPEEKQPLTTLAETGAEDTGVPVDTGDPPPEDLGDPYLAMVAAVPPGYLSDTCVLRIDVFVDGVAYDSAELDTTGGGWVGIPLQGDQQYSAAASYTDCSEYDPTGEITSNTFSGVAGNLFLFWFNGANGGYSALDQTEDFNGGLATITAVDGADTTGLETIAYGLGVTLTNTEGTTWEASFPTELPVGQVLAAFSQDAAFAQGSPSWIDAPSWW